MLQMLSDQGLAALFAMHTGISIKQSNTCNINYPDTLLLEIDWSKELW